MGGTASVLRRRAATLAALGVALAAYYAFHQSLPEMTTWADVAFLAFVLMPAVFALVWPALPLRRAPGLALLAPAFAVLAVILHAAEAEPVANFAKLGAMTALAFWFLDYFERLSWVVLVAALIPFIDSLSVWRGPTRHIVTEQREVFTTLSFAFPIPGEDASANLGLPDLLFFGLFLGAAARWGLRVGWTWLAMVLSFGATMALAVAFDADGLPALPGLAFTFLGVNGDRLLRAVRSRGEREPANGSHGHDVDRPAPAPDANRSREHDAARRGA
ncbi:MAG: hypothetical protein ICV59_05230 [Thermoleophilia bacterium]|nr:hypothetical protein [Thermoleophilia bacterium]